MPARQNTAFPSAGTTAHGYLAEPPSGHGPGLIVIQEWWGLTDHIADVTERFAREGFTALAPDLFGGRVTHDAAEAARMKADLPADRAVRLLAGAVDHLTGLPATTGDRVGAVGFCMGGAFVLHLAAADHRVKAAVPFYGLPDPAPDYTDMPAEVLGHYGERDGTIPLEAVADLHTTLRRMTGRTPSLYEYPAGHAFFNDTSADGYDPASAALAWTRTIAFLRTHLTPTHD
ncbi:dienelactone hydrolase family protein [Streptomyces sp. RFCAC02]|uniref:dienelactone hydrolase family protein n=1 Tax=Streptomyces sp. RFCAC02 TaxID=2499143 RepID=UPI0010206B33|nr:dienelactone hydrolase family protein [Streptomyces sp. RFCAC02]